MFTGLIQHVGTVSSLSKTAAAAALTVSLGPLAADCKLGDSIAVNGACLTAVEIKPPTVKFDVSAETLAKSTLGSLKPADKVNIELALRPDDRLGGHLVLGHVDATAKIKNIKRQSDYADITFTAEPEIISQLISKGSVAIDGISLTVASLDRDSFTVAVIPKTLADTTLAAAKTGQTVNLEIDMITKTVKRYLENMLGPKENLTIDKLRQLGF